MRLFRDAKGGIAYTIVESDDKLPAGIQDRIRENPNVMAAPSTSPQRPFPAA